MADWSWKQAVAKCILEIVNRKNSPDFTLEEVWKYSRDLSKLFPRNRNIRPKIRQILQRLRDDEQFLVFLGDARYRVNLAYEELQADPVDCITAGSESPPTTTVVRNVRLRNTFLAVEVKRRYCSICQVCRQPVVVAEECYFAEAHHLKPLGTPHLGPDVAGNIVMLCPNDHVLFDRGVASIVPDTLRLVHAVSGVFPKNARLYVERWHALDRKYLEYHHRRFLETSN